MNHAHPTLAAPARPLVESKPAEALADSPPQNRPAIGDIFISPRLIDSVAFREYAQQLRTLLDDAEHAAQSLRTGVTDAITTRRELDRARHEQVERLQAAGKVLRALAAVTSSSGCPCACSVGCCSPTPGRSEAPTRPVVITSQEPAHAGPAEALERIVAAAERRLSLAAQTAEREIERRAAGAFRALDERAIEIEARLAALARAEQSATEAATRADAVVTKLAEQGRSLAALHERVRNAVATLEAGQSQTPVVAPTEAATTPIDAAMIEKGAGVARDLTSLIDQSERVRRDVSTFLLESSSMLDELHDKRRSLAGAVRDAVLACEKAQAIADKARRDAAEA